MIYIAKELLIKNDDSDILLIHNEEGNRERERVVRKSGQEQARFTLGRCKRLILGIRRFVRPQQSAEVSR